jgi:hypothetical protein
MRAYEDLREFLSVLEQERKLFPRPCILTRDIPVYYVLGSGTGERFARAGLIA